MHSPAYCLRLRLGILQNNPVPSKMKKQALREKYKAMKIADPPMQVCKCCMEKSMKKEMEPHHPKGRRSENLLRYFWVHPLCHRWIHDNPTEATERGLLESGRNT